MTTPFFSIFIPKKGNPEYLGDAIRSVLLQDFSDFELVVSNNGANKVVKEFCTEFEGDNRFKYIEQSQVLNMPDHFDQIVMGLNGEYVLMLTERSVMKQGVLQLLHDMIASMVERPEVVSWAWDTYYDELELLDSYPSTDKTPHTLNTKDELMNFAKGEVEFPYSLPRGLNSCVSSTLITKIRLKHGCVFRTIVPDFSFAYSCLLNLKQFVFINSALFISQGHRISTGGNAVNGDTSEYINTLSLRDPFKNVPCKIPLVQNTIYQDFLATLIFYERYDVLNSWNKSFYYEQCFSEIDTKKSSAIMPIEAVVALESELSNALKKESDVVRQQVLKTRTITKKIRTLFIRVLKNNLKLNLEVVRKFLLIRKKSVVHHKNALTAAGFD